MRDSWTVLAAGDRTLILEFGQRIERSVVEQIVALNRRIQQAMESAELTGIEETVPTFRSLAVIFDPLQVRPSMLVRQIRELEAQSPQETRCDDSRHWSVPVQYGGDHGPDLDSVAQQTNLSANEVIELHRQTEFTVYMLGFLPGFAFMGDIPDALHLPRRTEPRTRVPAGSVAIANQLTGVYPWESPGGWHIIGHSPIPLFDTRQDPPALFRTGDTVSFRAIDEADHRALVADVESHRFRRVSLSHSEDR